MVSWDRYLVCVCVGFGLVFVVVDDWVVVSFVVVCVGCLFGFCWFLLFWG